MASSWSVYLDAVKAHTQQFCLYSDDQPRVPAGSPDGGQFTSNGGSTSSASIQDVKSSPALKAWLGDSVVKDSHGDPRVVYHSTNVDIDQFRPYTHFGTAGAANDRADALTDFFVDVVKRPERASGSQVIPVFLKIENPLRMPDLVTVDSLTGDNIEEAERAFADKYDEDEQEYRREVGDAPQAASWESETDLSEWLYRHDIIDSDEFDAVQYSPNKAMDLLKSKGYDGIVYENAVEDAGSDSYIIFDPSQVVRVTEAARRFGAKHLSDFDEHKHPRVPAGSSDGGQFASASTAAMDHLAATYPDVARRYAQDSGTEMGSVGSHTRDVIREWSRQMPAHELAEISDRWGHDLTPLLDLTVALHDIGKGDAVDQGDKHAQHEHTTPVLQRVLSAEGFAPRDIALATELVNHDMLGPLMMGISDYDQDAVASVMRQKAVSVGMDVGDYVHLQVAFFHADAGAYPYVKSKMVRGDDGKLSFKHRGRIESILALGSLAKHLSFDPDQPRDDHGRWTNGSGGMSSVSNYSARDIDAIEQYVGNKDPSPASLYVPDGVNGLLRGVNRFSDVLQKYTPEQLAYYQNQIRNLQAAIKKSVTTEDRVFYRGVDRRLSDKLVDGSIFIDRGFTSITTNKAIAERNFRGFGDLTGRVFEIHVPKGTPLLDVDHAISGLYGDYTSENEHLLGHGTKFRVRGNTLEVLP